MEEHKVADRNRTITSQSGTRRQSSQAPSNTNNTMNTLRSMNLHGDSYIYNQSALNSESFDQVQKTLAYMSGAIPIEFSRETQSNIDHLESGNRNQFNIDEIEQRNAWNESQLNQLGDPENWIKLDDQAHNEEFIQNLQQI